MRKLLLLARILILGEGLFLAAHAFNPIEDVFILLIPTYFLLLILLLSRISVKAAAIASLVTGLAFTFLLNTYEYYLTFLAVSLPLFAAFVCFLVYLILTRED